ncbi:hypothetical protein M1L60_27845 [Actinoplanes sp. TRM 88003]|uniref:Uncharacterized protein n=1 Tax=Paractinoplanes aksuensis TaxID=2939490 RepID=A0ABT1DUB6_9ACTN|nr:hypothetical protein [Actinoplanes aksuensis]MCO8274417.1 hypothetical protein [Actinoplanes aksuensis]
MNSEQAGEAYPQGQLAAAFVTALTHENAATRSRAETRVARWMRVLTGMAAGSLRIGSRTPVAGFPAWVTPEVVRGGFATGTAAAGGPLRPHEAAIADDRAAVFAYYLTDAGQAELCSRLDSGRYRLEFAEQAALLAMAWLLRSGDRDRALGLLEEIGPYGGQLSFSPVPADAGEQDPSVVWRADAGEVRTALAARRENSRVEAMREAMTVWNPFADELLTLWLTTGDPVATVFPGDWHGHAEALLARYDALAAAHTLCGKHRKPKENLAVLRAAAQDVVHGGELTPRQLGLLRSVVAAMVVDDLIAAGVLPSAEVLAELVPQLAAQTNAAAYPDPALRTLMAATYRAFRERRSLLLLNLQHQVRLTELPWVRALRPYREEGDETRRDAQATLRRLGELAVDGFPATLLPNPLVRELAGLSQEAGAAQLRHRAQAGRADRGPSPAATGDQGRRVRLAALDLILVAPGRR